MIKTLFSMKVISGPKRMYLGISEGEAETILTAYRLLLTQFRKEGAITDPEADAVITAILQIETGIFKMHDPKPPDFF
jgi:hypothetical protein